MKQLRESIASYKPYNRQEQKDKELMLSIIDTFGLKSLYRTCTIGHFTTSAFIFNIDHTKVLMCEHIIDKSLSWIGGHSDGMSDLLAQVKQEILEETGLTQYCTNGKIASLTAIAIPGHIKKGIYVPSHVHLDVAYIFEADENAPLISKPDENTGVYWVSIDEMYKKINDIWKFQNVYQKLIKQYA